MQSPGRPGGRRRIIRTGQQPELIVDAQAVGMVAGLPITRYWAPRKVAICMSQLALPPSEAVAA